MPLVKTWLDFVCVGAQKAGTTSLHDWLSQVPGICLPKMKETHYFSHDEQFALGQKWYDDQFARSSTFPLLRGEIDPEYLYYDIAAKRLAMYSNVRKVIIVLRYPLDRAFSHYQMSVRRGYEDLDFDVALKMESQRLVEGGLFSHDHHSYIARSLYAKQIKAFVKNLPLAEYKYVLFEDLIHKEHGKVVFEDICEFIGMKKLELGAIAMGKASNQASNPRSLFLRDQLYHGGWLKKMAGTIVPDKWKLSLAMYVDRINQRPLKSAEKEAYGNDSIPKEVVNLLQEDVQALSLVTGLNLTHWTAQLNLVGKSSV